MSATPEGHRFKADRTVGTWVAWAAVDRDSAFAALREIIVRLVLAFVHRREARPEDDDLTEQVLDLAVYKTPRRRKGDTADRSPLLFRASPFAPLEGVLRRCVHRCGVRMRRVDERNRGVRTCEPADALVLPASCLCAASRPESCTCAFEELTDGLPHFDRGVLADFVREGTIAKAAKMRDVGASTFYRWLAAGRNRLRDLLGKRIRPNGISDASECTY